MFNQIRLAETLKRRILAADRVFVAFRAGRNVMLATSLVLAPLWYGTAHAFQAATVSEAEAAEAEANRFEAAAIAWRQRAAALKQLEAANRALAAAQVLLPASSPPFTPAAMLQTPVAPAPARAVPVVNVDTQTSPQARDVAQAIVEEQEKQGRQKFGGLEFGVGISFTLDVGKTDRIREAELVNGIVRVKDEDNGRARIMLESHYFFKPEATPFGLEKGDFGWGPFMALQPGTDNIIEAVALGAMMGFRRPGAGSESFNLGLGVVVDPNTRVLGDAIIANEALPTGETAIRYKEEMQTGMLLLASFGF